jgi:uncharacterized circularly permuted ATP-grasp superfamily protein
MTNFTMSPVLDLYHLAWRPMGDLFDGYRLGAAWDEMFVKEGQFRPAVKTLYGALLQMSGLDLRAREESLARGFLQQGVTFDYEGHEHAFPLDIVPRVIDGTEWAMVASGVSQRVRVLERFLGDIYGAGEVVSDGVIPRSVIVTSKHFQRAVAGLVPPNGVRVHVSGIDLVRGQDGQFRVLEDNVRVPSGVSYVMENRRAVAQVFPEAFAAQHVRPVSEYPRRLLAALRAAAPSHVVDPTVVVLTPGVHNSAYFEHALLARSMGVELVEGRDLVCSGNRVKMRTTSGGRTVDVIYRRVDDDFLDPVHFRADSVLGCPGMINAARAGTVTIANAVGNGVADDKLVYTYVPDLIRYYLGEEPILANVATLRPGEPADFEQVMDRLADLVLKPVDGSGGKGIVIGPAASADELEALRVSIAASPRDWIAQPVVQLSTAPTLVGNRLRPRHVDLRPFAVNNGTDVWVLPGGLTRVALPEGELIVNSSRGGGSKDTWVLSDPDSNLAHPDDADTGRFNTAPRRGDRGRRQPGADPGSQKTGQQQQRQQQGSIC